MSERIEIRTAENDPEISRCYAVMAELRPHLTHDAFVEQVKRQASSDGYRLAFLAEAEEVRAVAGYRFGECLAWGRFLYVDDLVTAAAHRSKGYGAKLLDWLVGEARAKSCEQFHLDSGVQRFDAHRFYLLKRMAITAHHFAIRL